MLRIVWGAFLCVFLVMAGVIPTIAQTPSTARVVTPCGTVTTTYTPGQNAPLTVDTNGNLCDGTNGSGPGSGSQPYNYTPLTPGQFGLGVVSSTALTIPTGALQAQVCAETQSVRYTWDGTTTPTASVGTLLVAGQCIPFSGATLLANLRFIQTAATATLDVQYTK